MTRMILATQEDQADKLFYLAQWYQRKGLTDEWLKDAAAAMERARKNPGFLGNHRDGGRSNGGEGMNPTQTNEAHNAKNADRTTLL